MMELTAAVTSSCIYDVVDEVLEQHLMTQNDGEVLDCISVVISRHECIRVHCTKVMIVVLVSRPECQNLDLGVECFNSIQVLFQDAMTSRM